MFYVNCESLHQIVHPQSDQGLIDPDKQLFLTRKYSYFSYFSMKTYVVGTN